MSQYPFQPPSPYQYPPGYGYDPLAQYLAPARRAGVMMIVFGSIMILMGLCCGALLALPREQMQMHLQEMQQRSGQAVSVDNLRAGFLVVLVMFAGIGIPMAALGIPIRRGSGGAMIAGIVVTSLPTLGMGLFFLASIVHDFRAPAQLVFSACFWLVPLVLFILQIFWLAQALRANAQVRVMQMQYQQQYWQHQQQQQMYGQQPQPPATPPPPTDGGTHGPAA